MNLESQINQLKISTAEGIKNVRYNGYIFATLLFLSVLGVAISDGFETLGHWYWTAMVPFFFGACLYLERQTSQEFGLPIKTIVFKQIQHWLGLLVGIYLTFFLRKIGSLDNQTTGLILLLLLALTIFLAGVTMGWLFRLLGVFLGICLIFVAYSEHYLGFIIGISIIMLIIYHCLTRK